MHSQILKISRRARDEKNLNKLSFFIPTRAEEILFIGCVILDFSYPSDLNIKQDDYEQHIESQILLLAPPLFEVHSFRILDSTLRDHSFIHSFGYEKKKAHRLDSQAIILIYQPNS